MLYLRYERLPKFCYFYGLLGHSQYDCLKKERDLISVDALKSRFSLLLRADVNSSPRWSFSPPLPSGSLGNNNTDSPSKNASLTKD